MLDPNKNREPIAGYVVKQRIGVGGYGEVWSADAPGGLPKAIKFVYGYFDDERAARELKALNRIKEVRHPFLLSLERIEVIDGQLVVVSELADMSLKDRFEQVKDSGFISRDELLGYMRDAADALDYLSEQYSLQHLDVKPENLLLVGGRVKVADFGLVKELHDGTASLMGGMTPLYAPPEVFDGRPSSHSDQYSLAIVYQEMLTGVLPFPGRTQAQLAAQHLHARPRLSALPTADQPVIARALSKDPQARFANCRALVQALASADQAKSGSGRSQDAGGNSRANSDTKSIRSSQPKSDTDFQPTLSRTGAGEGGAKTQVLGQASSTDWQSAETPPPVTEVVDLPPLEVAALESGLRPALFIGLGGTGGRVLRHLRRRLSDRLGPQASVPAMQMLLFDTDAKSLYQTTQGDAETALTDHETIPLPLRTAHDYATDSRDILQWMSRRWLYNIPRSLQTEGRRPLGRLALVDHSQRAFQRIRQALQQITSSEARETSAAAGVEFRNEPPRVYIVSSIAGGTGGGILLDVVCAVRKILADMDLSDEGVCGILTHSTDRNPTAADLSTANAYACLSEVWHYSRQNFYPGDPACGLPACEWSAGPFPQAYLLHLGDRLNEEEFEQATDQLSTYLYLDAASPIGGLFQQCRPETVVDDDAPRRATLGTFGLITIGSAQSTLAEQATERLCREVVDGWRGAVRKTEAKRLHGLHAATGACAPKSASPAVDVNELAAVHARQMDLDLPRLKEFAQELLTRELGGDAQGMLPIARQLAAEQKTGGVGEVAGLLAAIKELLGAIDPTEELPKPVVMLPPSAEREIKKQAVAKGTAIRDFLLAMADCPRSRVGGAAQAKQWYATLLKGMDTDCVDRARELRVHVQTMERGLLEIEKNLPTRSKMFGGRKAKAPMADIDAVLVRVIDLRIEDATLQAARDILRHITAHVSAAGDQVKDLQRELARLAEQFESAAPWEREEDAPAPVGVDEVASAAVAAGLQQQLPALVAALDEQFQNQFIAPQGGLRSLCQRADWMQGTVPAALRAAARTHVVRAMKGTSIAEAVLGSDPASEARAQRLQGCLQSALPKLNECGGGRRLLAILPDGSTDCELPSALSALEPPATVARDADPELVFCYLVHGIAIPDAAARLVAHREDLIPAASRLHTRVDIVWQDILPASARHSTACAAG